MTSLRWIAQTPLRLPSPLLRYQPVGGRRLVEGDLVLTAAGDDPALNAALVLGPVAPATVFARAAEFFGGAGYAVTVDAEAAPAVEAALRAAGWTLDEAEPALVLSPIPPIPPPPPNVAIRRVTTESALEEFMQLSGGARRWVPSLAAALDPAVALFVGYHRQAPVATARVACAGDVGDITGVVTDPAHRRRGFGTAMTWAAVAAAAARGCAAVTLTATEAGYPLYLRLGFVPVCTFRTFLPPPRPR